MEIDQPAPAAQRTLHFAVRDRPALKELVAAMAKLSRAKRNENRAHGPQGKGSQTAATAPAHQRGQRRSQAVCRRRGRPMSDFEIIPRHEPEIVEAIAAKQHYGDDEKVATTSLDHLIVRGVNITSRYQKADELDLMRALILALPPPFFGMVKSIWCDSKASCCYSVVLRERFSSPAVFPSAAEIIGACLETTLKSMRPFGHNGIDISVAKHFERSIYLNPNWGDDALPWLRDFPNSEGQP
jgi:hypothetical protein